MIGTGSFSPLLCQPFLLLLGPRKEADPKGSGTLLARSLEKASASMPASSSTTPARRPVELAQEARLASAARARELHEDPDDPVDLYLSRPGEHHCGRRPRTRRICSASGESPWTKILPSGDFCKGPVWRFMWILLGQPGREWSRVQKIARRLPRQSFLFQDCPSH